MFLGLLVLGTLNLPNPGNLGKPKPPVRLRPKPPSAARRPASPPPPPITSKSASFLSSLLFGKSTDSNIFELLSIHFINVSFSLGLSKSKDLIFLAFGVDPILTILLAAFFSGDLISVFILLMRQRYYR